MVYCQLKLSGTGVKIKRLTDGKKYGGDESLLFLTISLF